MPTSRRGDRGATQANSTTGGFRRFARDVAVNVIANLVAAAIIYLVATLSGLLPRNHVAYASAVVLVTMPSAVLLYVVAKAFLRGRRQLGAPWACA